MSLSDRINAFVAKSEAEDEHIRQEMNKFLATHKHPKYQRESRLYQGFLKIKNGKGQKDANA